MAEAGFPRSLSVSRVNDFLTCPLLYRFRTIDRLPEAPAPAAIMGTLVHSALEDLFALPAAQRTDQAAAELFDKAWSRLQEEDESSATAVADRIETSATLLASYFALEDPTRLAPHALEMGFETALTDDFAIRGYIDRVDVAPDGRIRIDDYKTGKAPSAAFQDKAMFQMKFYALAWWRLHGTIPAMLQLLYLGNTRMLRLEPTESELLATERTVLAVRESIALAARTENFTATPSRLCDWCDHQALCPAKGGTPPPIPPQDLWLERSPITKRS